MSANVKHEFEVRGMHCGGCVGSVTRAVSRLPGVQTVEVSLEKSAATVQYDDALVAPAAIVAAIEAAGFEASAS
ncbi:MAG TPA: heavy metal-associated domain-containing protein [Burkholderiales bacterium]|nr:heavy metal-associated domain-containing protein [Burkholderiales bacterium]